MSTTSERDAALMEFDRAHDQFTAALATTPPVALRYRPAGEDYCLGGLAVHVALVLEKYARLLEAMRAAEFEPLAEPPAPVESDVDTALIRDGFDDDQRSDVLERVRQSNERLTRALRAVPEDAMRRAVPVTYAGASEPFATTPADVLGWVHDHYVEHIRQVGGLQAACLAGA